MPWHDLKKYPRSDKRCTVYLFHFSRPFGHAKHYVGVTSRDVEKRIAEHKRGHGARLTKLVIEAGIELILARVWHNVPRYFELKLKSRGKHDVCPICREASGGKTEASIRRAARKANGVTPGTGPTSSGVRPGL